MFLVPRVHETAILFSPERLEARESSGERERVLRTSPAPAFPPHSPPFPQGRVNSDGEGYQWRPRAAELGAVDSGARQPPGQKLCYRRMCKRVNYCAFYCITQSKLMPADWNDQAYQRGKKMLPWNPADVPPPTYVKQFEVSRRSREMDPILMRHR